MIGDDLAGLLVPPTPPDSGLRQGYVISFNTATGANTVTVAGQTLTNLPLLNSVDAVNIVVGDAVVLTRLNNSWAILGRVVVPGSSKYFSLSPQVEPIVNQLVGFSTASDATTNYSLTTTYATKASTTLNVPSWANRGLVVVVSSAFTLNPAGGAAQDFVYMRTSIGGTNLADPIPAAAPDGSYCTTAASQARDFTVTPGGTVSVTSALRSGLAAFTADTANTIVLTAFATWTKN